MLTGIWDEFLTLAKEEAGSRVVETWFKAVSLYRWEPLQKAVYLQAPNTFVKDWIKNNYIPLFQMHLGRLLNVESPKIIFLDALLGNEQSVLVNNHSVSEPRTMGTMPAVQSKGEIVKFNTQKSQSHINSNYLFSNFIVGPSNSLAYAACHAITEKPGKLYNPLFMYGGCGLGKTHLLHAIGNEIKNKNKNASVLYQPADRFVNEFISAIRFDKIHKFQAKYKDVDVLLIDDIQFISNKEQTQEAFFHIFNTLYDAHKQIVFSSDTFPQNIQGIAERLRSRLAWGLVTDVHAPSLETKIAILKKKAELSGAMVNDDVAHFIAARVVSNIRELEGALVRVVAFSSLTKQPINLELARKVLIRTHETVVKALDLDTIARNVGRIYSFGLEDLQSKSRNKELAFARQIAMFLMKKLTDKSFRDIGIYLGGRDHSTVMHAVEKISGLLLNDQALVVKLKCFEDEFVR